MQYRLHTLMLLAGIAPPLTAFFWFHWRLVLFAAVCLVAVSIWVWVSLSIARFFGNLVASMMG